MLGIHLGETEDLGIGQRPAEFFGQSGEVSLLVGAKGKPLPEVILVNVVDINDVVRLAADVEHL